MRLPATNKPLKSHGDFGGLDFHGKLEFPLGHSWGTTGREFRGIP
jgi:hypothetical protein